MLVCVGCGYLQSRRYEEAKVMRAKVDCVALAAQVENYYTRTGNYPGSIAELARDQPNGGAPLVPADKVNDPWGKPYQLDITGVKVCVFTTTPEGVKISNLDTK